MAGWMRDETWFTANEALKAGMVTDITPGQKMVALASREELSQRYGYHNMPARLARVA